VGGALAIGTRRRAVLRALTPVLVLQLATVVLERAAPEFARSAAPGLFLLSVGLFVLMSIHVHRLVLIGPGAVPAFGLGGFGLREWRYLGGWSLQILVGAMAMVLVAPLAALAGRELTVALAFCVAAWCAGRIAMVLPGIAIDRPLDLRAAWRLGEGVGARLALLVVGLPVAGVALVWPAALSPRLPLEVFAILFTDAIFVWSLAAQSLAWQGLLRGGPASPEPAAERIALAPDASRGLLVLRVAGRFETPELGHLAARDGLVAYHGRIRGLVIELDEALWDPEAEDGQGWTALDTLLSHLAFVRIHHESLERVALVGAAGWAPLVADLGKHFAHAELRWYPTVRGRAASAWAVREAT
jgi:hypothetical protein